MRSPINAFDNYWKLQNVPDCFAATLDCDPGRGSLLQALCQGEASHNVCQQGGTQYVQHEPVNE